MNQASSRRQLLLHALCTTFASTFVPSNCWAAGQDILPWDYTLEALQNFVTGPFAHSVIVTSAIGAMLAFVLGGDNELARRFAKAVVGTGAALIAVRLLTYLVP